MLETVPSPDSIADLDASAHPLFHHRLESSHPHPPSCLNNKPKVSKFPRYGLQDRQPMSPCQTTYLVHCMGLRRLPNNRNCVGSRFLLRACGMSWPSQPVVDRWPPGPQAHQLPPARRPGVRTNFFLRTSHGGVCKLFCFDVPLDFFMFCTFTQVYFHQLSQSPSPYPLSQRWLTP